VEFVEGNSLESILAKGKLSEAGALKLTVDLLKALAYAHKHGVFHYNLKPSNLIVTSDGTLKVTDFVGSRRGATPFTAPERLKGQGDARSDLFSVGVILYLMLSGFRPFQGSTEATIGFKLVHQHPVPVAAMDLELSPELDFVIGRFLAKNSAERYQTAEEALRDIEKIRKAKQGESSSWVNEPTAGRPMNLLDVLGFRGDMPRLQEIRRLRPVRRAAWVWWLLPIGVTVSTLALLASVKALSPSVPSAPVLSVHLRVPSLPLEPPSKASKSARNLKIYSIHAATAKPVPHSYQANADIVAVPVELRHPFRECVMSIWVDEKLAYKNRIRGERKSRFLHMGTSSADYLTLIQVPTGNHSVKVEVNGVEGNYDASGSLSATFSKANDRKLRVTADKSRPQLDLQLN
jgi:serine/threonine-protein kinase